MTKLLLLSMLALASAAPAYADMQSGRSEAPRAGALNESHITGTGETVPNPGASQGAGVTPLDRGVYRRDDAITHSICKGC